MSSTSTRQALLARRVAAASAVAYVALALAVGLGLMDSWDASVRERARPGDVWGPLQLRANYVVEGLRPALLIVLMAVGALLIGLIRRSIRPVVFAGAVGLTAGVLTESSKLALGRPDPHGAISSHGGSFPSGHTLSVVIFLGLLVFLVRLGTRWWAWLAAGLAGATMGAALLVQSAHWATDVLGGGLLAAAILATVGATGYGRWSADTGVTT